jgi:DNA-binding MarR family transcriptional regulator
LAKSLIEQEPSAGCTLGRLARELYRERRLRDASLPSDLFGEAAWDMLLDLFASAEEGRTVRVSSACIAAAVPASTALRYLAEMERTGLITRSPSPGDKRGQIVRLTASSHRDMRELLKRIRSSRAHPSSAVS